MQSNTPLALQILWKKILKIHLDLTLTPPHLALPFCENDRSGRAGRLSCLFRVHCHCPGESRGFPPVFSHFSQVSRMFLFHSWLNICKAQLKQCNGFVAANDVALILWVADSPLNRAQFYNKMFFRDSAVNIEQGALHFILPWEVTRR